MIPRGSARTAGIPAGDAAGIRAAIPAGPPYRRSPAGAAIPTRRQASVRSHHSLGSSFEAVHACPPRAGPSGPRVPVLVKGIFLSVESGVICRRPDIPRNFRATSPEPVTTAAPPWPECARRGLDLIPPPNRKDETMQDTVDQAHVQCVLAALSTPSP